MKNKQTTVHGDSEPIAFDCVTQNFVTGAQAIPIRLEQLHHDLGLLHGESGCEFAQWAGGDRGEMIARYETELCALTLQLAQTNAEAEALKGWLEVRA